jgi:hypothetical protein
MRCCVARAGVYVKCVHRFFAPPGETPRWWVISPPMARSMTAFFNDRQTASTSSWFIGPFTT